MRGADIGMIFQEPMTSLNPVLTIGRQLTEAIRVHHKVGRGEARALALDGARRGPDRASRSAGYGNTRTSCPAACASG